MFVMVVVVESALPASSPESNCCCCCCGCSASCSSSASCLIDSVVVVDNDVGYGVDVGACSGRGSESVLRLAHLIALLDLALGELEALLEARYLGEHVRHGLGQQLDLLALLLAPYGCRVEQLLELLMIRVAHGHELADVEQQVGVKLGIAFARLVLIEQLVDLAEDEYVLGLTLVDPLDDALLDELVERLLGLDALQQVAIERVHSLREALKSRLLLLMMG